MKNKYITYIIKTYHYWLNTIKYIFIFSILLFLVYNSFILTKSIINNQLFIIINKSLLFGALGMTFIALMLSGYLWHYLLRINHVEINLRWSLVIFIYSHLGRYIPGKIWSILGRVVLSSRRGVDYVVASQCVALEIIISVASACSLSFMLIPFLIDRNIYIYFSISALVFSLLVFIHPVIFSYFTNIILRYLKKEEAATRYRYHQIAIAFALQLLGWLVFGSGFLLLVDGIYPGSGLSTLTATAAFAAAWVIGYISVLMPAGLGVREATLIAILSLWVPQEIATVAALLSRLLTTAADLFAIIIAILMSRVTTE